MNIPPALHRHTPWLIVPSLALFAYSAALVSLHAETIRSLRDEGVPLVATLPQLEQRMQVLKEQVEVSELHSALKVGSEEERIRAYVLPEHVDVDRLVLVLDIVQEELDARGLMGPMSPLQFGDIQKENDGESLTLSFQTSVSEDGLQPLLSLFRLAGALAVSDALSEDEVNLLFERTEAENPAGIAALEEFLSTDLLYYARNVRAHEDKLLRSFSGPEFLAALENIRQSSLLRDARRLFEGPLGDRIADSRLWPLPMLTITGMSLEPGSTPNWYHLSVQAVAHARGEK